MKNKKVIYFLIALIVIVYGSLAGRFFGWFENSESYELQPDYVPTSIVKKKEKDNKYELQLLYKDPFLGKISELKTKSSIDPIPPTNNNTNNILKAEDKKILPKVVYKGLVINKESDTKTGLIGINGRSYLISSNKEYDDVKVISFNETKCDYEFGGVRYSVEK